MKEKKRDTKNFYFRKMPKKLMCGKVGDINIFAVLCE